MSISLSFYLDANLTIPAPIPLGFEQDSDASSGPQTKLVYLGSKAANKKFETEINSGVDSIKLQVVNNQSQESHTENSVKLALQPEDLTNTQAGIPLNLPATILSGFINIIPIYIQVENHSGEVGIDTSLSLTTNSIIETEIEE